MSKSFLVEPVRLEHFAILVICIFYIDRAGEGQHVSDLMAVHFLGLALTNLSVEVGIMGAMVVFMMSTIALLGVVFILLCLCKVLFP